MFLIMYLQMAIKLLHFQPLLFIFKTEQLNVFSFFPVDRGVWLGVGEKLVKHPSNG